MTFAMLEEGTMQKVSLEHIYVLPMKLYRQRGKALSTLSSSMQTNFRRGKNIYFGGRQTKAVKKQSRRDCLPEQPQHMEEMIPSEIQMV